VFAALAAFETRVQLRNPAYRIGLLVLVFAPLAALLIERGRYAPAFFGYGYIASVALRLYLGVAEARQSGLDLLLSNFASAQRRMAARLAALLVRETVIFLAALLLAALVWGNVRIGAWYALEFTLVACLLLPLATAVELSTNMRSPGPLAILIAFVLSMAAAQYSDPASVLQWLGITQSAGSFAHLSRLSLCAALGVLLTLIMCWLWTLARRERRP
jgi:hypothetical protein